MLPSTTEGSVPVSLAAESQSSAESIAAVVMMLLTLVLILLLAYWFTKKVGKRYGAGAACPGAVKIIDKAMVAPDRMILLVQAADKTLLVGCTAHSMQTLCELDPQKLPVMKTPQSPTAFSDLLQNFRGRYPQEPTSRPAEKGGAEDAE